jgi:hypothetical protein
MPEEGMVCSYSEGEKRVSELRAIKKYGPALRDLIKANQRAGGNDGALWLDVAQPVGREKWRNRKTKYVGGADKRETNLTQKKGTVDPLPC